MRFTEAEFVNGQISFYGTEFSGCDVSFGFDNAKFADGQVGFRYAEFSGGEG